jgi:hypothetical protein
MTRRATVLASCLIAVFAVSAVISALASASMTLPTFSGTAATSGTGTGGKGALTVSGGASIKCESASASYTLATRNSGPVTIDFATCTQGGEECHSLGDTGGVILVTGTWHLVLDVKSSVDGHYALGELSSLHVECPKSAVKLLLVAGTLLGSTSAHAGSEKVYGLTVKDNGGTAQEFSEYENNAGTAVKTGLTTQQEGGKAKESFEEATENTLTFNGSTKIEN